MLLYIDIYGMIRIYMSVCLIEFEYIFYSLCTARDEL